MAKKTNCDINLKKNQPFFTDKVLPILIIILSFSFVGYFWAKNEWLEYSHLKEEKSVVLEPTPTFLTPTPIIRVKAKVSPVPTSSNRPQVTPTKQPLPVLSGSNIFNMVNSYRVSNDKPFLSVSNELCRLAELRADYMMANNMAAFNSIAVGGHPGFDEVANQYSGNGLGENLAKNAGTDAFVIKMWENSPPHKETMLLTERDGIQINKGCVATRVSEVGSVVVLLVGDK